MKQELIQLSVAEIIKRKDLKEVNKVQGQLEIELIYQGVTFTLVTAKVVLGKRTMIGEGISRKSLEVDEQYREVTGYNEAKSRALEAVDKKLRRRNGYIGHKYEG